MYRHMFSRETCDLPAASGPHAVAVCVRDPFFFAFRTEQKQQGRTARSCLLSKMVAGEHPIIVEAPSSKSQCKACKYLGGNDPFIQAGTKRVGIPGHAHGGVTMYHWCHPVCFAQHCLRVDVAPTGRAKCKADGTEIAKGATRFLVGYKKESTIYKVENAQRTILPELITLAGRSKVTIHGLGELSLDERARVERALFDGNAGSGGSGSGGSSTSAKGKKRPAASAAPAAAATKAPKLKSKGTRRKARGQEDDSDDGEQID